MLRLEQDREDYGALLKAPEGFVLEAAVGTTYSLQLEPFTLAMISLGLGEDTDSFLKDNPVGMLKAIQFVTDKVVLFHESGQILVDKKNKNNKLYPLLEKTIVPVALESKDGEYLYPAFHPKMWLLSYINPTTNEKSYRFIVMSRNLTYDRSWDVVIAFDGKRKLTQVKKSNPIADFLNFLVKQISDDDVNSNHKREILDKLQKEVKYVEFECDDYCDLTVLPMGIESKEYSIENDNWLKNTGTSFHELVIFSPFISASIIRQFNDRPDLPKGSKRNLIIRDSEIKKLKKMDVSNFDGIWRLKSNIICGENELSDENVDKQKQDIHAKIFMFSRENKSVLYFGSMNASHRAFYTNVELDIRLDWYKSYMGPSKFLDELGIPNGKNNPFEQIYLDDIPDDIEVGEDIEDIDSKLEQAIKHLCRMDGKAYVTKNEYDNYNIDVLFSDIDKLEEQNFTIQPLCHNQVLPLNPTLKFSNIELENLSEFYVVSAKDDTGKVISRIIIIPTEGIPESRDKKLFNMILDDKRKFYEYISFILSDNKVATALENESSDGGLTENKGDYRITNNVALYEKMLEAALHHRERLEEIESAIKMLPEENELQNDFIPLYEAFKKALNKK